MDTIIKVALGVFLGSLMIFLVRVAYVNYVISEVTETFAESNNKIIQQSQNRIKAQREKVAYEQRQKELMIKAEKNALAQKKAYERKKSEAWSKYYKQPEDCLSYKSEEHMVECGNIRVRARREFEKKWAENSL